jgi:predicted metalloprotease
MRWRGREESENVEDRRGLRVTAGRRGGIGCGGLLLVLGIAYFAGVDPRQILGLLQQAGPMTEQSVPQGQPPAEDDATRFVRVVLKDTENTWSQVFQQSGRTYAKPTLVLFEGQVDSACGFASSAAGPFYCSADGKVYMDLAFFRELSQRFGASGDFAAAYVIAHEVGHHVQNQLGISDQVAQAQRGARSEEEANTYLVRLELQADCFAGVYGHFNQRHLEPGDVEEGLRAAAAIGDDTIQKQTQGYVVPESFTHGTSAMRVHWLRKGLEAGDPAACDTFQGVRL